MPIIRGNFMVGCRKFTKLITEINMFCYCSGGELFDCLFCLIFSEKQPLAAVSNPLNPGNCINVIPRYWHYQIPGRCKQNSSRSKYHTPRPKIIFLYHFANRKSDTQSRIIRHATKKDEQLQICM